MSYELAGGDEQFGPDFNFRTISVEKKFSGTSRIVVTSEKPLFLSSGIGKIFTAHGYLESDPKRRDLLFVLKKFKHPGHAARAFGNYKVLSELDVPTYTTYRIDNDNNQITMTKLDKEGNCVLAENYIFAHTASTLERYGKEKLESLDNFEELVTQGLTIARKLSNGKLVPDSHTYFFIQRQKDLGRFDIFLGDLDKLENYTEIPNKSGEEIFAENKKAIGNALRSFIFRNVVPLKSAGYMEEVDAKFNLITGLSMT